jgi:hypothetical protein
MSPMRERVGVAVGHTLWVGGTGGPDTRVISNNTKVSIIFMLKNFSLKMCRKVILITLKKICILGELLFTNKER